MYSFLNDYSEGAHPNILRALETINYHQNNSYGLDEHSQAARDFIQEALEDYSVDIHFIAGGTLTNLTFISHVLRPYEAVISAETRTYQHPRNRCHRSYWTQSFSGHNRRRKTDT